MCVLPVYQHQCNTRIADLKEDIASLESDVKSAESRMNEIDQEVAAMVKERIVVERDSLIAKLKIMDLRASLREMGGAR